MSGVYLHVRTCTPRFYILGTAWPIMCSNLVYGLGKINYVLSTSHGWGASAVSAREHVRTPFPYLGNRFALVLKFGGWLGTQ